MNSIKNISILFSFFILVSTSSYAFADHGSGSSGGGCSGDCTPPTLGIDNSGREFVNKGLTINNKEFSVKDFKQDIETQEIPIGEPVIIRIRIYENQGTHALSHVGLMLGLDHKFVGNTNIEVHNVEINWDKTFDGIESIEVKDDYAYVEDVKITHKIIDNPAGLSSELNELEFIFTPTTIFQASPLIIKTWDN